MTQPVQHELLHLAAASEPFFVPLQDWRYEARPRSVFKSVLALATRPGMFDPLLIVLWTPVSVLFWPVVWLYRCFKASHPSGWIWDGTAGVLSPVRQAGVAAIPLEASLGLLAHDGQIDLTLPGRPPLAVLASFHCNDRADREAVNRLATLLCDRYGLRLVGARA